MKSSKSKRPSISRKRKSAKTDPGPLSTTEQAIKANNEALMLLRAIWPLNLPYAAEYIRQNPPSADAIAMLGFNAHRAYKRERNSAVARARRNSTIQKLRDLHRDKIIDLETDYFQDVRAKVPELDNDKHTQEKLSRTISKVKKELKELREGKLKLSIAALWKDVDE